MTISKEKETQHLYFLLSGEQGSEYGTWSVVFCTRSELECIVSTVRSGGNFWVKVCCGLYPPSGFDPSFTTIELGCDGSGCREMILSDDVVVDALELLPAVRKATIQEKRTFIFDCGYLPVDASTAELIAVSADGFLFRVSGGTLFSGGSLSLTYVVQNFLTGDCFADLSAHEAVVEWNETLGV